MTTQVKAILVNKNGSSIEKNIPPRLSLVKYEGSLFVYVDARFVKDEDHELTLIYNEVSDPYEIVD